MLDFCNPICVAIGRAKQPLTSLPYQLANPQGNVLRSLRQCCSATRFANAHILYVNQEQKVKAEDSTNTNVNPGLTVNTSNGNLAASTSSASSQVNDAMLQPGKRLMTAHYRGVMWDATAGSWRAKIKIKSKVPFFHKLCLQLCAILTKTFVDMVPGYFS